MRLQRLWRVTLFHIKQKPELIIIWAAIPIGIITIAKAIYYFGIYLANLIIDLIKQIFHMNLPLWLTGILCCGVFLFVVLGWFGKLLEHNHYIERVTRKIQPLISLVFGSIGFIRLYLLWFGYGLIFCACTFLLLGIDKVLQNGWSAVLIVHTIVLILLSSKLGEKRINKWYLTSRWALTNHNVYSRNVLRGTIYLGYCIGLIWTTCLDLEREVSIATKTLSQLMLMSFAVFIAFEKAQDFISQSRKAYKRHCSPEASEYASIWKGD